jgi:hypothetical protein
MSLDGVVQAPGGATEDTSGGFQHGGCSMKFFDPDVMGAVVDGFAEQNEVLLQGRRTYQVSAEAWPGRTGGFADWINAAQKYVVSDSPTDEDVAAWTPTTIIRADLVNDVHDHSGRRPCCGGLGVARPARRRHLRLRQPDRRTLAACRQPRRRARPHDRADHAWVAARPCSPPTARPVSSS